jgi:hypothetical protein
MKINDSWWAQYGSATDRHLRDLVDYEMSATSIDEYGLLIPALLQTERYAEGITIDSLPFARTDELIRLLTHLRMQRQQNVFSRNDVPKMRFLIDESALLRCIGSADVMREQLGHLLAMAKHDRICIRVIPLKDKSFFCGLSFLTSFSFGKAANFQDIIITQTGLRMEVVTELVSVSSFKNTTSLLQMQALDEEASLLRIGQILEDLEKELATIPRRKRKIRT